jgi:hypothetical protein
MKKILQLATFFISVSAAASAQVVPAATGPSSLPVNGNLQYALRYAQTAQFSSFEPNLVASTVSGSLNYTNTSQRLPFIIDYGGGYTWTLTGPDYESGVFQRMLISQGIDTHKWKFLVSDNVSYLPQAPTLGFSGIPGTGEPIGVPNPGPLSSQTILSLNTHVVDNAAAGKVEHVLSYATTVSAEGWSELLRFPNNDGLDTDTLSANGQIEQRLTARNALFGRYAFSEYSYPGSSSSITTNTALVGFKRIWTRNLTTEAGAGPEWIASTINTVVPTTTNFAANATVAYKHRFSAMDLRYGHGTNGGSGYLIGGLVDTVQGDFSHEFGPNWSVGMTSGYERTSGLNSNGVTNTVFGGAQATWRAGRNLIVFANYTGTNQSLTGALPTNVLNQLLQVVGFGFGYSPRVAHLRQ